MVYRNQFLRSRQTRSELTVKCKSQMRFYLITCPRSEISRIQKLIICLLYVSNFPFNPLNAIAVSFTRKIIWARLHKTFYYCLTNHFFIQPAAGVRVSRTHLEHCHLKNFAICNIFV